MDSALRDRIGEALAADGHVVVAFVFGSTARGSAGPGSDVDVAVVAPGADVYALASRLLDVLGRDVDLVDLTDAPVSIVETVLREGIPVYERAPGEAAQWRSGAMGLVELDRPLVDRMQRAWLARIAEVPSSS